MGFFFLCLVLTKLGTQARLSSPSVGLWRVFSIHIPVWTRHVLCLSSCHEAWHKWVDTSLSLIGSVSLSDTFNSTRRRMQFWAGPVLLPITDPSWERWRTSFSEAADSSWSSAGLLALGSLGHSSRWERTLCFPHQLQILSSFLKEHLLCKIFAKIAPSRGMVSFCDVIISPALFLGRAFFHQRQAIQCV